MSGGWERLVVFLQLQVDLVAVRTSAVPARFLALVSLWESPLQRLLFAADFTLISSHVTFTPLFANITSGGVALWTLLLVDR